MNKFFVAPYALMWLLESWAIPSFPSPEVKEVAVPKTYSQSIINIVVPQRILFREEPLLAI
jgi:hypothetical protein